MVIHRWIEVPYFQTVAIGWDPKVKKSTRKLGFEGGVVGQGSVISQSKSNVPLNSFDESRNHMNSHDVRLLQPAKVRIFQWTIKSFPTFPVRRRVVVKIPAICFFTENNTGGKHLGDIWTHKQPQRACNQCKWRWPMNNGVMVSMKTCTPLPLQSWHGHVAKSLVWWKNGPTSPSVDHQGI